MKFTSAKSILVALIGALFFAQSAIAEERVLATVDGNMIMESQVIRSLGKKANTEANRKAALESIIDETLVQQAVKKAGIKSRLPPS